MNNVKPKQLTKVSILQTPNRLNYSKEDFRIILGDLCKQASESNVPYLVEVSYINTDDTTATRNNTICTVYLPILPERYGYEKTVDNFFTFWTNESQANTLALLNAKPKIAEYANYIQYKVRNTPSDIKEFLVTGKHEEFEKFRANVDDFMGLVRHVYPEKADDVNAYISSCASGSVRLQGLTGSLLTIARYNDSIYPVSTDEKQTQRLVDCLCFNLAQTQRWAFENCEDAKAETLSSFRTFDEDFILDMENRGRIADSVCKITLPVLEQFDKLLQRNQTQPGSGNN